jgi:hypothetical protein
MDSQFTCSVGASVTTFWATFVSIDGGGTDGAITEGADGAASDGSGRETGGDAADAGLDAADADATSPSDARADSTLAADSSTAADSGQEAGALVPQTVSIPNGDEVAQLAVNRATNTLYASLVDGNGNSGGIAVIDTNTNTVTTTIPPVTVDGGAVQPYTGLVVDPTANVVYGARLFSTTIDTFAGATNAYVTTFNVSTLDPGCHVPGVFGFDFAVDSTRSLLYFACPAATASDAHVSVVSTTPTYTLAGSITLSDLNIAAPASPALALDSTNQLLFVSNGGSPFAVNPLLVDRIDTSTLTENVAAQQNLGAATTLGMVGAPGYAALLAVGNGPDAGSGTVYSLEGAHLDNACSTASTNPAASCGAQRIGASSQNTIILMCGCKQGYIGETPLGFVLSALQNVPPQPLDVDAGGAVTIPPPVPGATFSVGRLAVSQQNLYFNGAFAWDGGSEPSAGISCIHDVQ